MSLGERLVNILVPVGVLAIGGIFYLAWNHPKGYDKFRKFLYGVFFIGFMSLTFWNGALIHSLKKVEGEISVEAADKIKSLLFLSEGWDLWIIFVAVTTFFIFLPVLLSPLKDSKE